MDLLVFVLLNNSEKSKNKMLPNIFQKKKKKNCRLVIIAIAQNTQDTGPHGKKKRGKKRKNM